MLHRLGGVLDGLLVYPEAMAANLNKTRGLIYSQQCLLALTRAGMNREEAYAHVQAAAMRCWSGEGDFLDLIAGTPEVVVKISREELGEFFDPKRFLTHVDTIYTRVFG